MRCRRLNLFCYSHITYLVAIDVAVKWAHCTAQAATVCPTMLVSKLEHLHPHHQRSFSRDILTESILNAPSLPTTTLYSKHSRIQVKNKYKKGKDKFNSR